MYHLQFIESNCNFAPSTALFSTSLIFVFKLLPSDFSTILPSKNGVESFPLIPCVSASLTASSIIPSIYDLGNSCSLELG